MVLFLEMVVMGEYILLSEFLTSLLDTQAFSDLMVLVNLEKSIN